MGGAQQCVCMQIFPGVHMGRVMVSNGQHMPNTCPSKYVPPVCMYHMHVSRCAHVHIYTCILEEDLQ